MAAGKAPLLGCDVWAQPNEALRGLVLLAGVHSACALQSLHQPTMTMTKLQSAGKCNQCLYADTQNMHIVSLPVAPCGNSICRMVSMSPS